MSIGLVLLLVLFTVSAVLFGAWKGGPAERAAAAVVLINMLVGMATRRFAPGLVETAHFANDGLAALVLLAVTIRYGAPWMGGVMLFYASQFALHSFYLVTDRPNDYFRALVNNINFAGVIWCLIIGTAVAWRARARKAKRALQSTPA